MSDLFTDYIMSRARRKGITTGEELARACRFAPATTYRRLNDGEWTRKQMIVLHRVIGIDQEGIEIYLGKEVKS